LFPEDCQNAVNTQLYLQKSQRMTFKEMRKRNGGGVIKHYRRTGMTLSSASCPYARTTSPTASAACSRTENTFSSSRASQMGQTSDKKGRHSSGKTRTALAYAVLAASRTCATLYHPGSCCVRLRQSDCTGREGANHAFESRHSPATNCNGYQSAPLHSLCTSSDWWEKSKRHQTHSCVPGVAWVWFS